MITVAIPNYNYSKYICHTIESVLLQKSGNYEIIVYDDASTDDSVQLIRSTYGNKVVLIEGKQNCGSGASRNRLLNYANGDFILFLDGDDLLAEDALIKLSEASKGYDVVFGMTDSFSESDEKHNRHVYLNEAVAKYTNNNDVYALAQIMSVCNKLISVSFLRQHDVKCSEKRVMEDALFAHLLAFSQPKVNAINDIILHIRQHSGSLSCYDNNDKLKTVVEVTQELIAINNSNGTYAKLKLNGNNLVYFLVYNSGSSKIFNSIVQHKNILSLGSRILIALKLLKLTGSTKYLKIV